MHFSCCAPINRPDDPRYGENDVSQADILKWGWACIRRPLRRVSESLLLQVRNQSKLSCAEVTEVR